MTIEEISKFANTCKHFNKIIFSSYGYTLIHNIK